MSKKENVVDKSTLSGEEVDRFDVTEGGGTFKCPGGELVYYSDFKRITEALRGELVEQARLNGMGAERELALMAERDQLRAQLAKLGEQGE